jgi:hypothetical protein
VHEVQPDAAPASLMHRPIHCVQRGVRAVDTDHDATASYPSDGFVHLSALRRSVISVLPTVALTRVAATVPTDPPSVGQGARKTFGPVTYDRMKIDAGFLDRGPLNRRRHDGTTNQRRDPNSPSI